MSQRPQPLPHRKLLTWPFPPYATTTVVCIDRLPTNIWWYIIDHLSTSDLRRLRRTCRWFEDQTFRPYVARTFRKLEYSASRPDTNKLLAVENYDAAAESVRFLVLVYHHRPGYALTGTALTALVRPGPHVALDHDCSDLIDRLGQLETITLRCWPWHFVSSCLAAKQLGNALARRQHPIRNVNIQRSSFSCDDLVVLLQGSKGLQSLILKHLRPYEGRWIDLFHVVKAVELRRFCLRAVHGSGGHDDGRQHKYGDTDEGGEVSFVRPGGEVQRYRMRRSKVQAWGGTAVNALLEAMIALLEREYAHA